MLRYIVRSEQEDLEEFNNRLKENDIDFDFDSSGRYIIGEEDAVDFEEIADELELDYDAI